MLSVIQPKNGKSFLFWNLKWGITYAYKWYTCKKRLLFSSIFKQNKLALYNQNLTFQQHLQLKMDGMLKVYQVNTPVFNQPFLIFFRGIY